MGDGNDIFNLRSVVNIRYCDDAVSQICSFLTSRPFKAIEAKFWSSSLLKTLGPSEVRALERKCAQISRRDSFVKPSYLILRWIRLRVASSNSIAPLVVRKRMLL